MGEGVVAFLQFSILLLRGTCVEKIRETGRICKGKNAQKRTNMKKEEYKKERIQKKKNTKKEEYENVKIQK